MLKNSVFLLLFMLLAFGAEWLAYPSQVTREDSYNGFSIDQAMSHVERIADSPHYVGARNHRSVKNYIVSALQQLGLQVYSQQTDVIEPEHRVSAPISNILARIEGSDPSAPAVLLMSHYDSRAFVSYGAGDAASGVAVILEGLRAHLKQNPQPRNDLIVLITDAEEIGLMGARAFVQKHAWAKDVGLVLNFEARGTAGPAIMLMETNQGNAALLDAYAQAEVPFPVTNSISYAVYKMMPNDMDLTVFRELADIQGFNFAFIDNHFDYHTALDRADRLSLRSLAHQATHMMPLLTHFLSADLSQLRSTNDAVFFTAPVLGLVKYPATWAWPLAIFNALLVVGLLSWGRRRRALNLSELFSATARLLALTALTAGAVYLLTLLSLWLQPGQRELLHGFPYNGHAQVNALLLVAALLAAWQLTAARGRCSAVALSAAVALIWAVIVLLASWAIPGASYLVLIALPVAAVLALHLLRPGLATDYGILLLLPAPVVLAPLIFNLPVAMGLSAAVISAALVALLVAALAGVFDRARTSAWAALWLLPVAGLLYQAQSTAGFNEQRPRPNSLSYLLDTDAQKAWWLSFDAQLDDWNRAHFDRPLNESLEDWQDREHFNATHVAPADIHAMKPADVRIDQNREFRDVRRVSMRITPANGTKLLRLRTHEPMQLYKLTVNGAIEQWPEGVSLDVNDTVLRHFSGTQKEIDVTLEVAPDHALDMSLWQYNPSLLTQRRLGVLPRPANTTAKNYRAFSDLMITRQRLSALQHEQ